MKNQASTDEVGAIFYNFSYNHLTLMHIYANICIL